MSVRDVEAVHSDYRQHSRSSEIDAVLYNLLLARLWVHSGTSFGLTIPFRRT